jgi:hypothetical protein
VAVPSGAATAVNGSLRLLRRGTAGGRRPCA